MRCSEYRGGLTQHALKLGSGHDHRFAFVVFYIVAILLFQQGCKNAIFALQFLISALLGNQPVLEHNDLNVERCRRLVKHQNGRIAQDGAGYCQALPLSS